MQQSLITIAYIAASALFILSLGGLSQQETARRGNLYGILGMLIALVATGVGMQTGGLAVAAISTRSRPFCRAIASACGGGMIPSCEPSSSMTRTSRALMRSLTRVRSSRRGLRSNAIKPPR